jgi:hypothetical protein
MKVYWGVEVYLHAFSTSTLDGSGWTVLRTGHFTPKERAPDTHTLDRRLGGHQSRSGRGGEDKNSHPLSGLEHPIIQPVAQCCTTELSRLHILNNYCVYFASEISDSNCSN